MTASIWSPGQTVTPAVNANLAAAQQVFTPTAGQTLFNLTSFSYVQNTGSLVVFVNGIMKFKGSGLTETSTTSFTLDTAVGTTDSVVALGFTQVTGAVSVVSSIPGNLTFAGASARLIGDFTNATLAQRLLAQTVTSNSTSNFGVIPSGTGTGSSFISYNSSAPDNSGFLSSAISSTEAAITSGKIGSGTYLPLNVYVGGLKRWAQDASASGHLTLSNTSLVLATPTSIAAAATTDLDTVASNSVIVSNTAGATTITSFGTAAPTGTLKVVQFSISGGSIAITTSGGAGGIYFGSGGPSSISVATDDVAIVQKQASGSWIVLAYKTASGSPLVAPSGGFSNIQIFTSSGSFNATSLGVTKARITAVGGGGGAGYGTAQAGGNGGYGGFAQSIVSGLTGTYTVTVGTGGTGGGSTGQAGTAGTASSFGSLVSATGGTGGAASGGAAGTDGAGTVSSGTASRTTTANNGTYICSGANGVNAGSGTAAIVWSISSVYSAGARGVGGTSNTGGGGVGGVVIVEY